MKVIRTTVAMAANATVNDALNGQLFRTLEVGSAITVWATTDNAAQEVSASVNIQSETLVQNAVLPIELVADAGPDARQLPIAVGAGVAGDEIRISLTNAGAGTPRVDLYVQIDEG